MLGPAAHASPAPAAPAAGATTFSGNLSSSLSPLLSPLSPLLSSFLQLPPPASSASCAPITTLTIKHVHWVYDVTTSDLGILTASEDRTAKFYSLLGSLICTLRHGTPVLAVCFLSLHQRSLPPRACTGGKDGGLRVWSLVDGTLLHELLGEHHGPVRTMTASHDGRTLVSAGLDGVVRCWRVDADEHRAAVTLDKAIAGIHARRVMVTAVSLNDSHLLSAGYDCTAQVVEIGSGEVSITFRGHTKAIRAGCFIPNWRACTGGKDCVVKIWNWLSGMEIMTLPHPDAIVALASCTSSMVLSACADAHIRIFDADNGRLLKTLSTTHSEHWTNRLHVHRNLVYTASDDHSAKAVDVFAPESARFRALAHAILSLPVSAATPCKLPVDALKLIKTYAVPRKLGGNF